MSQWIALFSGPIVALILIVWERAIGAPRTDWWINLQSWALRIFGAFTVYGAVQAWQGPALIDGAPVEVPMAPPYLGEHTFEVYRELAGMSDEEIAAAIGEGVFA